MRSAPSPLGRISSRGFTLVEIMVVVVIIGLLAALALPAFQRTQRATQNARVVNDFRVFAQAFEIYNSTNGFWPNNVGSGVVPTLPVPMAGDFKADTWQAVTTIGGRWNWDNSLSSGGFAGISIANYTCTDAQLTEIDAKIDDGDLATGNFKLVSSSRVTLVLATQ
jgi:prepilin-type N-terminal cleavage/methylation domain-containing protein